MSDHSDLRASHSVELLARLTRMVSEFARLEEELRRDLATLRNAIERKHRDSASRIDSWSESQTAEAEQTFAAEQETISAFHERRRARIQRLYSACIRQLPRLANRAKERWLGDLQMRQFRSERTLTDGKQAAATAFALFHSQLSEQFTLLQGLGIRAQEAFSGYSSFLGGLGQTSETVPESQDEHELLQQLSARVLTASEQLEDFRRLALPRLFSSLPLPICMMMVGIGGLGLTFVLGPNAYVLGAGGTVLATGAVCFLHQIGKRSAAPLAQKIAVTLAEANRLPVPGEIAAEARRDKERQRLLEEWEATNAEIRRQWDRADHVETDFENLERGKLDSQLQRLLTRNAEMVVPKLRRVQEERSVWLAQFTAEIDERRARMTETYHSGLTEWTASEETRWAAITSDWHKQVDPIFEAVSAMHSRLAPQFPPWSASLVEAWTPPTVFPAATRFAQLVADLESRPGGIPKDQRLALPGAARVSIPLSLVFPQQGSLLFESSEAGGETITDALNNIVLRLFATTPPGKLSLTIIDPVGLGQNFAGLMHFSDYEESLINRRIWTQRDQIEQRLAELSDHIEKVIQMYLRNEYATITEYNAQAGSVAEKYQFLVVSDFPANFSEIAAKRLQSIALSGPRCGIFTLIHWDQRHPLPDGFVPDELRKTSLCVRRDSSRGFVLVGQPGERDGVAVEFERGPGPEVAASLVHKIGKSSIDSNRVEVPFSQIAPLPADFWSNDTTQELRVPIGRTGATKLQYLAIGKGTRQHALFAGKTGSGKSTLFHVIITNLALACSPEQVEFYLIDFKKGVEFKCYASKRLPHARVVAIESDREFALSVLQRVDDELKRRGDMFRKLGVQDIAGYKRAGGTEPVPRSLLLIDEFQEFFVEDDSVAQTASLLFDRIVRQGRAFGIHVILGSQTLGGAYSLARATLGQMVIRVALQCNEADAYLIMDDSNPAPRLLSRPGEGIYNDAAGAIEGNSPFQVVWLPDDERDLWLDRVNALAQRDPARYSTPIVFEGNAPADIRDNDPLRRALATTPTVASVAARAWLGAPNSIKGPTEASFQRQSGNHLLIVGQRDEAALTMLGISLLSLAAQYPSGTARFVLFDASAPGSPDSLFLDQIMAPITHPVTMVRGQDVNEALTSLADELKARTTGQPASNTGPVFVLINGLQRFKKLRQEDDFSFSLGGSDSPANPSVQFSELISEGSTHGIHLIVAVDTFNNVNRFMNRKVLSEFEMRVVFQMSANDSASLIDSPKASNLGLHRALFYNEHDGSLETFRPYAVPDTDWMKKLRKAKS